MTWKQFRRQYKENAIRVRDDIRIMIALNLLLWICEKLLPATHPLNTPLLLLLGKAVKRELENVDREMRERGLQ